MTARTLLPYLDDDKFLAIVQEVLTAGIQARVQAEEKFASNVIDPFLMLFEISCFRLNANAWEQNEKMRQSQKTLANKIGWFHQKIIGALDGWEDLGTRELVDVVCHEKRIIAEIKNKFNTVKQSDLIGLYEDMANVVLHKTQRYHGYTAYYVEIIPKKAQRYDRCFTPSNRKISKKAPSDNQIRQIDGASFYALATGFDDALAQLFNALPEAIGIILKRMKQPRRSITGDTITRYFSQAYGS